MAYKAEVIADSSGTWAGNALVFATAEEASLYVADLKNRWFSVTDTRIVETDAAVNYQIVDGVLSAVEGA